MSSHLNTICLLFIDIFLSIFSLSNQGSVVTHEQRNKSLIIEIIQFSLILLHTTLITTKMTQKSTKANFIQWFQAIQNTCNEQCFLQHLRMGRARMKEDETHSEKGNQRGDNMNKFKILHHHEQNEVTRVLATARLQDCRTFILVPSVTNNNNNNNNFNSPFHLGSLLPKEVDELHSFQFNGTQF